MTLEAQLAEMESRIREIAQDRAETLGRAQALIAQISNDLENAERERDELRSVIRKATEIYRAEGFTAEPFGPWTNAVRAALEGES